MTLPSRTDWLFSIKAFIAAMLALYIALAFDLPRPYWSMAAVYVVASPFAGATASKALYRALGTVIGATAAVVFTPLFVNAPFLFSAIVSLWTGTLLYISLLDRTPRGYVFMLSGYTLPLIALPLVDTPALVFDTAVARSEEILLGITCASIVSAIVLPTSIGTALSAKIGEWTRDARQWGLDILSGTEKTASASLSRQKLVSDLSALDLMLTHLTYDAGTRDVAKQAHRLRGRLLMLLPILSSLGDRIHALRSLNGEGRTDLDQLFEEISVWVGAEPKPDEPRDTSVLRSRIATLRAAETPSLWARLIRMSALSRLEDLLDLMEDCDSLRLQIATGKAVKRWRGLSRYKIPKTTIRHFDYALLAYSAGVVVVGTMLTMLIWIYSGWDSGAGFATMFAVACSFFAVFDRPAPLITLMFKWTVLSLVVAFVYLFAILPMVHDYWTLVLVFAPPFLLIGLLIPRPQYMIIGMLLLVNTASYVALGDRFSVDFTSFVNGGLAAVAGLGFAIPWTLIARPFGEELAAGRLVRQGWADIADSADGRGYDRDQLFGRLLDRLGQVVPRLSKMADHELSRLDGLAEVRVGFNVIELQRERPQLEEAQQALLGKVLSVISRFYKARVKGGIGVEPPTELLEVIDTAIVAFAAENPTRMEASLNALVGLRRAFFPDATPPIEDEVAMHDMPMLHAAE